MGVTRELATVLIRQLVERNGWNSCATSSDTRDAHSISLSGVVYPRALPFHSWRGVLLKEIIEQLKFLHLFYLLTKKC